MKGAELKEARKKLGLTQWEFAWLLGGYDAKSISRLEYEENFHCGKALGILVELVINVPEALKYLQKTRMTIQAPKKQKTE
jgi:DNA-binding transcriptional regulator YiaG